MNPWSNHRESTVSDTTTEAADPSEHHMHKLVSVSAIDFNNRVTGDFIAIKYAYQDRSLPSIDSQLHIEREGNGIGVRLGAWELDWDLPKWLQGAAGRARAAESLRVEEARRQVYLEELDGSVVTG